MAKSDPDASKPRLVGLNHISLEVGDAMPTCNYQGAARLARHGTRSAQERKGAERAVRQGHGALNWESCADTRY
jgi:hypothetical protein